MIIKYQKITDKFTTHVIRETDSQDDKTQITELCTIGKDTYVYVPDDVVLPEQKTDISVQPIVITAELKAEIKKFSPHVRLINRRVIEKIRQVYTIDAEIKALREFALSGASPEFTEYTNTVKAAQSWGDAEKEKIGLKK